MVLPREKVVDPQTDLRQIHDLLAMLPPQMRKWLDRIVSSPAQYPAVLNFDEDEEDRSKDSSPRPRSARQRFWLRMVEEYCHRNLTNATDRLPALSGMAKVMSNKIKDRYLAGLWEEYLPQSLVWWVVWEDPSDRLTTVSGLVQKWTRPFPYIAPMWSPLSSRRQVCFHQYHDGEFEQDVKVEIDVLETHVDVRGLNPYGTIRSGHLRLRGRILRLRKS